MIFCYRLHANVTTSNQPHFTWIDKKINLLARS